MALAAHARMPSQNYSDLIAWQKAMDLVEAVYHACAKFPSDERYRLTSQMRRAAVSIPANIAEGQGRRKDAVFHNHLSIAHGSIRELQTHLLLAVRLRYLDEDAADGLLQRAGEVGRMVTGLANSLKP